MELEFYRGRQTISVINKEMCYTLESGKCCGRKKGSRVGVTRNAGLGKARLQY